MNIFKEVDMVRKNIFSFKERVLMVVSKIPQGQTLSYAEVARRAGSPRAYRAVGTIMALNFDASIPCHRVIRSSGDIGNYNRGGSTTKHRLLLEEKGCS